MRWIRRRREKEASEGYLEEHDRECRRRDGQVETVNEVMAKVNKSR
jgi:hypothetical protein